MNQPPATTTPPPAPGSKFLKPLLIAGCLGLLLTAFVVGLAIGGWYLYSHRTPVGTDTTTTKTAIGTAEEPKQILQKREDLLAQPLPPFLRAKNPTGRSAGPQLSPPMDLAPVVLATTDVKSADLETRFMQSLLSGQVEGAAALTTDRWKAARGMQSLKLFAGLAEDHGGGTFTPERSAHLPDNATATTGQIAFKDGTTAKATILAVGGQVDGFTAR